MYPRLRSVMAIKSCDGLFSLFDTCRINPWSMIYHNWHSWHLDQSLQVAATPSGYTLHFIYYRLRLATNIYTYMYMPLDISLTLGACAQGVITVHILSLCVCVYVSRSIRHFKGFYCKVEHISRLYAIFPRFSTADFCQMLSFKSYRLFFAIPNWPFCPCTMRTYILGCTRGTK